MSDELQQIPLADKLREHGAKMTDFGGFEMPVQFAGVTEEHHAVRQRVGLFDISHMGEIEIRGGEGTDAIDALDHLITNNAHAVEVGQGQYTAMCNEEGGVIDDLVWFRLDEKRALAVVNAACREKDLEQFEGQMGHHDDMEIVDRSDEMVLLALQGPQAEPLLQELTDIELEEIGFYRCREGNVGGAAALVSRTGYTGEDGFEIYVDADHGEPVFERLMSVGEDYDLQLCGLGARDTLRLEAMLNLYGHEMDESVNPYECRMGWTVKLDHDEYFVGREALEEINREGPKRRLRGFVLQDRGVIREGYTIKIDGEPVGEITSGTYGPTVDESIGLGHVEADAADAEEATIEIRGRDVAATVTNTPFYSRED